MRIIDNLFCIFVIVFLLWMLPLFALWIRLDSKGPIFFRQTRVGRNEVPFECIKFRTMNLGTQNVGTHEVAQASVTKAGNILRKLKIDELPQTWNLLKGEMSLIGPRPSLPTQIDVVAHRRRLGVYKVLPGISGLAQVHKVDMSEPEKLAHYDALYIRRRNVCLDLVIVLQTVVGRGSGDRIRNQTPSGS